MDEVRQCEIRCGEGKAQVLALADLSPAGLVVRVYAGAAHVGSVVWAFPRPSLSGQGQACTSSVLNAPGHKDEAVARPLAERLCRDTGLPVLVTAGLHLDQASQEDIENLCAHAEQVHDRLMRALFLDKQAG